jgi:hypothetical protein
MGLQQKNLKTLGFQGMFLPKSNKWLFYLCSIGDSNPWPLSSIIQIVFAAYSGWAQIIHGNSVLKKI